MTLGKGYDRETIGYKIMVPDSNLNIKFGYCLVVNNAGKTLFNQRDVIEHHFSYICTSLIQTVNKSPVIGMFVV